MRRKNLPKNELEELLKNGMMVKDIAKKYECSRTTVSKYLKEYNLLSKRNEKREENIKILKENHDFIINEYVNNKKSLKEIGNELQISPTTIKNFLIKNDVKIRNISESHRLLKLNEHYFDKIDTLEKAYILGFICADGWVSNNSNVLGFTIHNKDKEVLFFIKEQLESDASIKTIRNKYVNFEVHSKHMFNTLKSYEILPNKSLILNLKKVMEKANLNDKQKLACMLGYFDGDGGFSVSKPTDKYKTIQYSLGITGTHETCECYEELFEGIGFYTKRHKDNKNNYTYRVSGKNRIKQTMGKIYSIKDELDFCFERKYKIFKEC